MLSKCGIQFFFRYVLGIRRPPSAYLLCGKAVDRGVTVDLGSKIETGSLVAEDILLDTVRDAVEKDPDAPNIQLDEDEKGKSVKQVIGETKDKAIRLARAHHTRIAPKILPVAVQRRFAIDMDKFLRGQAKQLHDAAEAQTDRRAKKVLDRQGEYLNVAARRGIDFVGEMDVVEKIPLVMKKRRARASNTLPGLDLPSKTVIRDTKTSKKSPTEMTADESHQLSAYATALRVIDKALPDFVKLDYLVDLKRETKTVTLESTRDDTDVQIYLNRVVASIATIQSGMFQPAPNAAWWCTPKYCGYWDQCPHVRHKNMVFVNDLK